MLPGLSAVGCLCARHAIRSSGVTFILQQNKYFESALGLTSGKKVKKTTPIEMLRLSPITIPS